MNKDYQKELDSIIKRVQKDARMEIADKLWERYKAIDTILTNGRPIFEQTLGYRFNLMFTLRSNLYSKMEMISEIEGMIYEMN